MPVYVALLRAVNVGGTGKLAMADLKAVCDELGFAGAKTFIQSGNVVFRSDLPEPAVQAKLEQALAAKMGKAPESCSAAAANWTTSRPRRSGFSCQAELAADHLPAGAASRRRARQAGGT